MENKNINIPEVLWADFINILYAAIQHIVPTEKNRKILQHMQTIVQGAFEKEEVLVVNGKIVDRKHFSNGK
jgi:hypothetical protein